MNPPFFFGVNGLSWRPQMDLNKLMDSTGSIKLTSPLKNAGFLKEAFPKWPKTIHLNYFRWLLPQAGLECECDHQDCSDSTTFIILDVGGTRFQVSRSSLSRYPDTRLGKLVTTDSVEQILTLCEEFRPGNPEEYFFDRNPG